MNHAQKAHLLGKLALRLRVVVLDRTDQLLAPVKAAIRWLSVAEQKQVGRSTETRASELLSGAQEGNMCAFEKLVERHRDNVYGLALQMTGSETCALDVAQTSFFSSYLHLNEFRTEADFDAWVRRSAAQLTMLHPSRVAQAVEDKLNWREFNERGGPAKYCPTDWSADGEPLSAELRHAIQGATQQLPRDQREVFLLKDFADLTYEQIAEITGHSLRAIKHRLHQARLSLREAIDRLYSYGSGDSHLRVLP